MDYQVVYIVCSILAFIPAIVCHEFMHGFAAYKLGDNTAKQSGRLTLNPLKRSVRHDHPAASVGIHACAGVRLCQAGAL